MDLMKLTSTDWVTCPYDPVHRMKYSKFHNHFIKCKQNHPNDPRKQCPYNASELIDPKDYDDHLIRCQYKVLFGNYGQFKTDLLQYDAPCHFKFGETSKPLRKTQVKIPNVDYNLSDEEIESVSVIDGNGSFDDDDYESDDVDSMYDVVSRHSETASAQKEINVANFTAIANTNTKLQMGDGIPSRSDGCLEQLREVFIPERGFGRGALFKKLKNSKDRSLHVSNSVPCPKEQNRNETVDVRSQESSVNGSQNESSPCVQLQFDIEEYNFNNLKIGKGRGAVFHRLSKK